MSAPPLQAKAASGRPFFAALALAAVAGCTSFKAPDRNFAPPAAHEPAPDVVGLLEVATALRAGGYVIYMRHGRTRREEIELEAKSRETGRFAIDDCATQRNLSPEGTAEVRAAGDGFRRSGIPVARFLSSRYCRVAETARMFSDRIEWSEALTSEGPVIKNPARIAGVRALLAERPAAGTNLMLFAHQGIFFEATGLTVQEGWAVVLAPGNFRRIVARIAPEDWARFAAIR